MQYILILIIAFGGYSNTHIISMQEFNSKVSCEKVLNRLMRLQEIQGFCIEK